MNDAAAGGATVWVNNIPRPAIGKELFDFFESAVGSVYACKISSSHVNWKSLGCGLVQFESSAAAERARSAAAHGRLPHFQQARLGVSPSGKDIIARAAVPVNRLSRAVLHVGFLSGEHQMDVLESWGSIRAEIMPEKKRVDVFVEDRGEQYKLEVLFGEVLLSYGCCLGCGGASNGLLLQLNSAPRIYQRIRRSTVNSKFTCFRYHACGEDFNFNWVRAADFSPNNVFGKSSFLCFELEEGFSVSEILRNLPNCEKLGDLSLTKGDVSYSSSELFPIISCPSDYKLAYEVIFQLISLVHLQKLSFAQVNTNLFDILCNLSLDAAIKILKDMHKLKTTCYDPVSFIQNQISRIQQKLLSEKKNVDPANLMSCHRVYITPTKVYFLGPELEKSNYVVKHYSAYASDFLRVSFVEEDWGKLSSDAISASITRGIFSKPTRTGIYNRILSVLRDGIPVGTKKFEFLAFSASQLRSNSVWMFASNDSVTAGNIREWMGRFKEIDSVSKCAARMGQQFSSSQQTLEVRRHDINLIEDVQVTIDNVEYCFSDGIGKISASFARQVAQKCGLDHTPSAFQIRYGGYKGVIAIDRTSFRKLSLRPSMRKFHSDNTMLNVTSWSRYLPCFLNREIISLLSTLGIEDAIFESMQHENLCHVDKMLTNREDALRCLEVSGDETRTAVEMLRKGYKPDSEPYLLMILKAYQEQLLSDIRSRCRIFVPKGRVLLGCLDETGNLGYGQVYVRVSMTPAELKDSAPTFKKIDQTAVIVGKVVVTKNPCLHPGDIRVLDAVYEPNLTNIGLVDCVVFPQKGRRPHPNECSGGDLDGDLYFVCWDEKLVPLNIDTPMEYIGRKRLADHEVTLEEIQKFFVDYMINDNLGIISTTHLAYADRGAKKARSEECLELAKLHSLAVDFAKTGAPAEMPKKLKLKEFPDFMERWDRPMYTSPGVVGKLYRAASSHVEVNCLSSTSICLESLEHSAYDHDLEVEGFEDFVKVAEEHYVRYAEKLSTLMNYYGAENEAEILTGVLRKRSVYLQRDNKRYAETKERMLIAVKRLHEEAKDWLKCSCAEADIPRMVSAWYHITYHPNYQSESKFLSFPWILSDYLLKIKVSKGHKSYQEEHTVL